MLGQPALGAQHHPRPQALRQRHEHPAELLGHLQVGPHLVAHLGTDVHVDGRQDQLAAQGAGHRLRHVGARLVLCLGRRSPQVGGQHHLREGEQRAGGERLHPEHVQSGSRHPPLPDRLRQRLLVDDAAA